MTTSVLYNRARWFASTGFRRAATTSSTPCHKKEQNPNTSLSWSSCWTQSTFDPAFANFAFREGFLRRRCLLRARNWSGYERSPEPAHPFAQRYQGSHDNHRRTGLCTTAQSLSQGSELSSCRSRQSRHIPHVCLLQAASHHPMLGLC